MSDRGEVEIRLAERDLTYKIWQGHKKNELEKLPYVFLVVSAPELSGEVVGQSIPDEFARFATILRASVGVTGLGKKNLEDAMAAFLIGPTHLLILFLSGTT